MSLWTPNSQKIFLPPNPVTKVLSTDTYVRRTNVYCHANSDRLLLVGHPLFEIKNEETVKVPKCSSNQWRVFRIKLPDPNRFAFGDTTIHNPETERLVWGVKGIDVGRGQPLGLGVTGHPLFNKLADNENPNKYDAAQTKDNRLNVAFDVKQTQMIILGCAPAVGEHWRKARVCPNTATKKGDCPPIELQNTVIQDGDMFDIGFGAMEFSTLQENKSDAPLDINTTTCKYPDFLKMAKETTGDSMFFFARREQSYARHFLSRGGTPGEPVPDGLVLKPESQPSMGTSVYFGTQSGSLVSSDAQVFNRPYWLLRSQGLNNGICWRDQLFVTVADNTRGTNMTISMSNDQSPQTTYDSTKFNTYTRHVEEFELALILQLCIVPLSSDVLSHLQSMNPSILEGWNLGVNPPTSSLLEDAYRFIDSDATRCPRANPPKEPEDPYGAYKFWDVDLTERLSMDLDQFPLGRKFIAQNQGGGSNRKRSLPPSRGTVKKRRKTSAK
ncbi:L1 [Canis familiaris papillomavirus 8]|uniref:Major capsid protein L1 n=2 Tax=Canis familiaris papillomavirus 8 TaxID=1081055 RepID=G3DRE3_9PAPI|nr:L1 [Canis familiaris papillomavirus 8]AEO16197.1 L1 [Canis familiaris papillomavirus 8]